VAAAAFAALVLVMTTTPSTLVRGLQKLGMPYTWAMIVGLSLSYLGTVGEIYTSITEAQQARGWDASRGGLLKRAKAVVPGLIALIVASLRLSDRLALGLAARGFGLTNGRESKIRRTYLHEITMTSVDWAASSVTTLLFLTGLWFAIQ
jgi:energy-coupling factor transport system permease protein